MDIFTVLDAVRKRPHFYLHEKSPKELDALVVGFQCGCSASGGCESTKGLSAFNDWVAKELGFPHSTSGWCNMILERVGSDEKAFDLFFDLLDKYRQETNP